GIMLPLFKDRSMDWWLEARTASEDRSLKILDVGCGTGRALSEITARYGAEAVDGFGLTAHLYEPLQIPREKITIGDLCYPARHYPKKSFDLIFSHQSINYSYRPALNVVKRLYGLLNDNGIAFLYFASQVDGDSNYSINGFNRLENWLKTSGYEFDFGKGQVMITVTSISFRKTHEKLLLPLQYTTGGVEFSADLATRCSRALQKSG
ncbi:class I SAM-dependent methyltransferase, partial [Patescibacteria group bacterium]|nr:class I SAM-dependent methyltransferase [Patescibacteria group bacterium]